MRSREFGQRAANATVVDTLTHLQAILRADLVQTACPTAGLTNPTASSATPRDVPAHRRSPPRFVVARDVIGSRDASVAGALGCGPECKLTRFDCGG